MAPIPLNVPETLRRLAKGFPIVAISRPRQADIGWRDLRKAFE
jgi:hypothetical protein